LTKNKVRVILTAFFIICFFWKRQAIIDYCAGSVGKNCFKVMAELRKKIVIYLPNR
jgi:hypothetical protein